ncbi:MAG: HDIG domain-containing metalloprotein [Acidimicrobiales bacterium]
MFQNLSHLIKRFWFSLKPGKLSEEDLRWVGFHLSEGEFLYWEKLSMADRHHSFQVAKQAESEIGEEGKEFIAAALLHDIGKLESGFGTFGRVFATLCCFLFPIRKMEKWSERTKGLRRRLVDYAKHPALGAELLIGIGSRQQVVTWVLEHHSEREKWETPIEIAEILSSSDND